MEDILSLIEQCLLEREQILRNFNDFEVASQLEELKESVMPGRLGERREIVGLNLEEIS